MQRKIKNNSIIPICECFKEISKTKYKVKFVSANKIYLWNPFLKKNVRLMKKFDTHWYTLGLFNQT